MVMLVESCFTISSYRFVFCSIVSALLFDSDLGLSHEIRKQVIMSVINTFEIFIDSILLLITAGARKVGLFSDIIVALFFLVLATSIYSFGHSLNISTMLAKFLSSYTCG